MIRKLKMIITTLVLKTFGSGKIRVDGFVELSKSTTIAVSENGYIRLGKRVTTYPYVAIYNCGGIISIGNRVLFNRGCMIACRSKVEIGDHCAFGPNVVIYDHDHRFDADGFKSDDYNLGDVSIGENCWIGANVTILRDTTIGDGCIIGAGSIIQGVIPEHSLVKSGRNITISPLK